ncbi:MAG: CDP-archaeol synthase [Actinobacteria bacterium]|nr:CDP-archaeol synthase [Actinomycetota bacterium]MBA3561871.1 CDP-archaeol synthase [Actinomycetota bacterium]MBA3565770.1 CDP-archaeol synthase [Actinomycetota bacterium]
MNPLLSRLLVAAALLPLVIGVVYLGGWWLFGLALVAGLLGLHELFRMARERRPLVIAGYLGFILTLFGLQLGDLPWMLGGILATLFLSFVFYGLSDIRTSATTSFGITLLGVVWVGAGLGLLLLVRDIPDHGFWAVIAVMFTVFAADTVAFFVGRTLGRHRMAPAISPAKTWEGLVAGVLAAMAAAFLILYKDRDEFLTIPQTLLLGAAVALAAVFGDLFESAVKRDLQMKDSGRLLGGHGGILDRLDALLWASPAAYFVILAVG